MANTGKPNFSFGGAAGAGNGQSPFPSFGSTPGSSTPGTASPFGASQTAATSKPAATGGLFGTTTGGSALGMFGSSTAGATPSIFGQTPASNPGSGTPTPSLGGTPTGGGAGLFSGLATGGSGTAGGMFGGGAGASNTPSLGGPGGFQFGQNKDGKASTTAVTENKASSSGLSFGSNFGSNAANKPASSSFFTSTPPANATTPSKPLFNIANSTTPAGPPPTDKQAPKSLFGAGGQSSFGGFGTSKTSDSTSTPASTNSLFPPAGATSGPSNLLKTAAPATSGTGTALTPAPASQTSKSPFSFPGTNTPASTPGTQTSSTTSAPAGSLFSKAPASGAAPSLFGPKPTTTSGASSNLFGAAATTTTAPSSSTPSMFTGLKGTAPAATSSAASAPGTTAPAIPSLFAGTQPTSTPSTTAPATGLDAGLSGNAGSGAGLAGTLNGGGSAGQGASTTGGAATLGASTSGPAPQASRLKNKTMDDIITRWASDLSKYQKEFQEQAEKVAAWDRLMVENGDKIQKLYLKTYDAEKQSTEIERQLANVESQQEELAIWLDRYEGEVDEMFQRQVGQGETLQGPDQERERTYKLAEKLTDRLDDMGKNLSSMIDAINDASTTLSKTSKADDPLSHIVRVLNSHLTQLQWIDENATALQTKIAETQKASQNIGSNGGGYRGPESDAAESFYRSLRR
ncbi:hypothetical protein LZ554_002544 [Drepanopeziza brunnea f. sp. 'monogermtubi']|nr:hypothetical protein LZ554_002544 [Drepanopeziza brunnea f. sp. 'monogermtubi']